MKKTSINIDYSNICKDYNTSYLDRDNTDPQTKKCMKKVVKWINEFISEFLENFGYTIYKLHSSVLVNIDEVASNRFLFYSLEKEITLQSFVLQKEYGEYKSLADYKEKSQNGLLIHNDEDGEGIYLYINENSSEHEWIKDKLEDLE